MTWLAMALAALAAVAIVLVPWWRAPAQTLDRRRLNVALFRHRQAELEAEIKAGTVPQTAAEDARAELSGRLVQDAEGVDAPIAARPARGGAIAIAILVPAFAVGWYAAAGSWRTQSQIVATAGDPHAESEAMVERLAERLRATPEGPEALEGWVLLARSYSTLERYEDAAKAYAEANRLSGGQQPDLLASEGEAVALAQDRDLTGRPRELFEAAVKLDPDNVKGLFYAGLAAAQAREFAAARERWTHLRAVPDLPEGLRQTLDQRLIELAQFEQGAPPVVAAGMPEEAPEPAASEGTTLQIRVSLKPELLDKRSEAQTLFVFAKAVDGPPMPLAVQRLPGASLPAEVRLDDSMAMMPALRLSQFERWRITARLSRGGMAQAAPGDLQGEKIVARSELGGPVELLIDTVVP